MAFSVRKRTRCAAGWNMQSIKRTRQSVPQYKDGFAAKSRGGARNAHRNANDYTAG